MQPTTFLCKHSESYLKVVVNKALANLSLFVIQLFKFLLDTHVYTFGSLFYKIVENRRTIEPVWVDQ